MAKVIGIFGFLAAIVVLNGPAHSKANTDACPMKQIVKARFCEKCDKVIEKDGITDGKCKLDGTRIKVCRVCVKESGNALVVYVCKNCKAQTLLQENIEDLKHAADCTQQEFFMTCKH